MQNLCLKGRVPTQSTILKNFTPLIMFSFQSAMSKVRNIVPTMSFGDDPEKVSFAKYGHGSGDTEMASIRVRRISSEDTEGPDDCTDLGGGGGGFASGQSGEGGDERKVNGMITRMDSLPAGEKCVTDQITEWQAGWNVTNAIQVSLSFIFILSFGVIFSYISTTNGAINGNIHIMRE